MAERLDLDKRAVKRMQHLSDTYGPGPLLLRIPGRHMGLVLDLDDVKRVLAGSPEPFAPATREKRVALSHFQPHGVLASRGAERADRRRFNEQVLGSDLAVHPRAGALLDKVVAEAEALVDRVRETGELTWDDYAAAWLRTVRRVVLGDAAREDHAVTDLLGDLRASANWAFLKPKQRQTRERFLRQLRGHLERAEPDSLAGVIATTPTTEVTEPEQQVPQWLFAYDAATWASYRALALIGTRESRCQRLETGGQHHCLTTRCSRPTVPSHPPPATLGRYGGLQQRRHRSPTSPLPISDTGTLSRWRRGFRHPPAGPAGGRPRSEVLDRGACTVYTAPSASRDTEATATNRGALAAECLATGVGERPRSSTCLHEGARTRRPEPAERIAQTRPATSACTTLALRAGVPVKVVSQRSGHADPAVPMQVYAHALEGDDATAAELTATAIFGDR
jgi:hypothetical protein